MPSCGHHRGLSAAHLVDAEVAGLAQGQRVEGLSQFANHLPQPQQGVLHRVFGIVVTQIGAAVAGLPP